MNQSGTGLRGVKIGVLVAVLLSIAALTAGVIIPSATNSGKSSQSQAQTLSYDSIAPYVKDYLVKESIVNTAGKVIVPSSATSGSTSSSTGSDNLSSSADIATVSMTVEQAITYLLDNGKLEYLKGDKGDTGARGATGQSGTDGQDGTNGTNGQNGKDGADGSNIDADKDGSIDSLTADDGLEYSGGILSLKPCAVDQVLSYNGTTWDCATVSASGVDTNTTNTSAALTLDGDNLYASITDSLGNTVTSNKIDMGAWLVDSGTLSDYATTASVGSLESRMNNLEASSATYATKDWVEAQSYLTSSGLATYLSSHNYVTSSALNTVLSGYLLKSDFAATLNSHLLAGKGVEISEDSNGNSVISSLQNAAIFDMVHNYLTVSNPDPNKIYVDLDQSPMKEYIYLNGVGGAPTDSTNPAAWSEVGSVTIDLSPYSTTAQMNTAISNALTNQLDDLAANSNVSAILSDYVKNADMQSAIGTATTDMATETWVNAQGFLTNSSLVGNATETWVNSQNFAKLSDLDDYYTISETDSLLSGKADQSALDATNVRVSALESAITSKQDKLTAGSNITISGNVISANVDLSTYATKSYVDSQDFLTNTSALSTYATQTFVGSQGFITSSALDGYATEDWVDSKGYLTSASLAGYAKESWVDANYLNTSDLTSYLQTNNYATIPDITAAINAADDEYVSHSEFADTLHANIKAGSGIAISADNTISATMFVMTTDHLTVTTPDPNMIYVETGVDASSPVSQYIYLNGKDGAPTDPTDPAAWQKIGDLSGVDLSGYSTTDQMNTAINNAIAAEVVEFNKTYATQSWVDSQGYLKSAALDGYATDDWVSENYLATSALDGYATQSWVNTQGFLKNSALSGYATQSWVTSQGFITSAALSGYATQTWVNGQGYLTADSAAATYVTQTSLASTLAAYQPLITGGASTITTANLTPGMILQSNADGKVVASGVSLTSLQTAFSDIAAIKTQQANNVSAISNLQKNASLGSWGEVDTGKTFRGKKVYRQDFTLYVSASANANADLELIGTDNYVDDIVDVGGWWTIGFQTERHQIPDAGDGTNYAYVLIYGGGNRLYFRSKANNNRSSATAIIIVEYTKK